MLKCTNRRFAVSIQRLTRAEEAASTINALRYSAKQGILGLVIFGFVAGTNEVVG